MPEIVYCVYFDNEPASQEQLDSIEEITVEQEVDKCWEARIKIPICVKEQGEWSGEDEGFMKSFSRVRVEIKIDDNKFIPLIDGPIVGYDSDMNSEPGQSQIVLHVHDDSVYLNRKENIQRFKNKTDHEIAKQLFKEIEQITETDVDETPPALEQDIETVQRGTAMDLLRLLARRQGKHAYVWPGDSPGEKSKGCFKSIPLEDSGLPVLVLLGKDRNLEKFNVQHNAQGPARAKTSTLNISDKGIVTSTSEFRNLELLGTENGFLQDESETAEEVLPPRQGTAVDPQQAVNARTKETSYSLEGSGSVLTKCYSGVLRPYQVVMIKGINGRLSGDYIITQVTHNLTTITYTQDFKVKRDAFSSGPNSDDSPACLANKAGVDLGAGASIDLSFNVSGSII